MRLMTKGVALAMLHPLADAAAKATNENRKVLRTLMRQLVGDMLDQEDLDDFHRRHGVTFNKTIDTLAYGALLDHIASAVGAAIHIDLVDYRDFAWRRCHEAMADPTKCHPKQRGTGTSRGYHLDSLSPDRIKADCRELIRLNNVPDTRVAAANTVTANPITQGATMTTTNTAPSTANTVFKVSTHVLSRSEAVGVAEAVIDIVGVDALPDVVAKMIDLGMVALDVSPGEITTAVRIDIDDDLNLTTLDDLTDELAEMAQSIVIAIKSSQPAAKTGPKAKASAGLPTLDPFLAPAVNALLQQASKGALTSIEGLIQAHADKIDEVTSLSDEIGRLKLSMQAATPAVANTGTVTVDRSTLTYKVVLRKAKDLFPGPNGARADVLDFDVVTLDWFDDTGTSVRHPDCPVFDATYQFRLRHLVKFLSATKFGQNIWLHGHTGTGKTTLAEQIAARLGYPIERLNLDSNLERADIVGSPEIVIESGAPVTRFREGILPRAMQQPCMFVLDEIDAGRPDVLFVIQRALEAKGITLTEDGGRTIQPHELFRFVATANSRGQGDEHGWYQGVRPMNLAMLNRFGAFIEVPYLDKDDEDRLLTQAYPALSRSEVMEMAQFAQEVRVAFKSGEISQTISPRGLHAMAQYFLHFRSLMAPSEAMRESVEIVVIDAAPADCEQRIRELADRVFS